MVITIGLQHMTGARPLERTTSSAKYCAGFESVSLTGYTPLRILSQFNTKFLGTKAANKPYVNASIDGNYFTRS